MRHGMFQIVTAVLLVVGLTGCDSLQGEKTEKAAAAKTEAPGQAIALADVPAPARAVIEKVTAGGTIRQLEKAEEGGRTVYDLEATVQGTEVEYDIAADGTILTSGRSVPYASVPLAVRHAAEKYFGSAQGLKAFVEVEEGKTFYEISGKKSGGPLTLKLSETGQIVEEEKE
ncbi:MAG: hypothetical protein MUC88_02040 [Planctomycetes bacterium]|nr:hypothetical protein [Planctomycetota bacterium]